MQHHPGQVWRAPRKAGCQPSLISAKPMPSPWVPAVGLSLTLTGSLEPCVPSRRALPFRGSQESIVVSTDLWPQVARPSSHPLCLGSGALGSPL